MSAEIVFIVDDDAAVRDSLSLLLSLRGLPSATFASGEDFLSAFQPHWRGCLVTDLRMPGLSGTELQAALRERGSVLPVVLITAHGSVSAARQAFLAQAVDFLEKPFEPEALLTAVQAALEASRQQESASLHEAPAAAPPPAAGVAANDAALARLSAREREVMELLVQGLHNRRIAEALGISHRTVEVHKARVMDKLGVDSVVELVRRVGWR
jgi:FixJ family two-component response regulator